MPKFIVGARLHDYGKGTPDELFAKVSADGFAARFAYKRLKRFERFARADNVVDDKNSFAFHLFRFVRAEIESLNSLGRDRADIDAYRGGHIYFFAFSCDDVLVFALLFCKFVNKRNGLCFRRQHDIVFGKQGNERFRAFDGQFNVAEDDKRRYVETVADGAER